MKNPMNIVTSDGICLGNAQLAEGTNANTIKTVQAIDFAINGIMYSKAATDNIAMTACAQQAALTTCLYTISVGSNITITVPRITVSVRVVDSQTQTQTIADMTGANTFEVWQALLDLTAVQKRAVMRRIIDRLVDIRAGLDSGLEE